MTRDTERDDMLKTLDDSHESAMRYADWLEANARDEEDQAHCLFIRTAHEWRETRERLAGHARCPECGLDRTHGKRCPLTRVAAKYEQLYRSELLSKRWQGFATVNFVCGLVREVWAIGKPTNLALLCERHPLALLRLHSVVSCQDEMGDLRGDSTPCLKRLQVRCGGYSVLGPDLFEHEMVKFRERFPGVEVVRIRADGSPWDAPPPVPEEHPLH